MNSVICLKLKHFLLPNVEWKPQIRPFSWNLETQKTIKHCWILQVDFIWLITGPKLQFMWTMANHMKSACGPRAAGWTALIYTYRPITNQKVNSASHPYEVNEISYRSGWLELKRGTFACARSLASEVRSVTCHMKLRSVTYHQSQVVGKWFHMAGDVPLFWDEVFFNTIFSLFDSCFVICV